MNQSFIKQLKKINWDFEECQTNYSTHDLHPYPAKFIPQIPRNLIEIFTSIGEKVYDPFCGCGTTVVEAVLLNRKSIANDINPLAILITQAKSTPLVEGNISLIKKILSEMEMSVSNLYGTLSLFSKHTPQFQEYHEIPNVTSWFSEYAIKELSIIKGKIDTITNPNVKVFLKAVFSSIIVAVSYQDSNTRYVHKKKKIDQKHTFNKFKAKTLRSLMKIQTIPHVRKELKPELKVADTRKNTGFRKHSADFAVTSPPYPNAYDYHLYHKHRMYWLKMDPAELKKNEIGAHAKYSSKNAFTIDDFNRDMTDAFNEISRVVKPNKYFCIVIGNSIIKGKKIDNSTLLERISKHTSLNLKYKFKRKIRLSRKSFNPRIGNI